MKYYKEPGEPVITPIKNGWAAHGDGWAIHAATPEEAMQKFLAAERRHREIDDLPFWYERFEIARKEDKDMGMKGFGSTALTPIPEKE